MVPRLPGHVQAPESTAAPQALALAAAVQQVLYLLAPQIEAQGVVVDLAGLPPALQVRAEPVALEQIIHNLVPNALQAMEAVPLPAGRRWCRRLAARSA